MNESVENPGETAWVKLVRAEQSALRKVEADLKSAGLPPLAWYDILLELERSEKHALRQRDIHRRMLLERYNVTRLVARMGSEGLVECAACPEDGRGAIVRLTGKGMAVRKKMWPIYRAAIERHFARHFSAHEAQALARLLGRIGKEKKA